MENKTTPDKALFLFDVFVLCQGVPKLAGSAYVRYRKKIFELRQLV